MKKIILASQSPRRRELLTSLAVDFQVHPSSYEETTLPVSAPELVKIHAEEKAKEVATHYHDGLVIGVDTVAAIDDHILEKPTDDNDAFRMLSLLANTKHHVYSGLCVIDVATQTMESVVEKTTIYFGDISEQEIKAYIATGEGKDKAGSFAIQGRGSLFIEKIEGDYFNVVGLPLYRLNQITKKWGYDLFAA